MRKPLNIYHSPPLRTGNVGETSARHNGIAATPKQVQKYAKSSDFTSFNARNINI